MKDGKIYDTTPGRVIVGNVLPDGLSFDHVNKVLTKKNIAALVDVTYKTCGIKATVLLCDRIKNLGYEYATQSGISIGLKDMLVPTKKEAILAESQKAVDAIEEQYNGGVITKTEKYNKVVDVWSRASNGFPMKSRRKSATRNAPILPQARQSTM